MEKYSVLMSVYAGERPEHLSQSIDSILNQTVKPDEIVLVEDGPLHEGLYRVIKMYTDICPDIMKVVKLDRNRGLGNALNCGMKAVRNELVARMDSDDISLPERCEMQLKAFACMPELSIVGTQMNEFVDEPENIAASRRVPSSYKEILQFSRRRSPFNHPTVMYRKSAVKDAGGYVPYNRKEDLELFIRMIHEGHKAVNLKKPYLLYRTDRENLMRRKTWTNCREYIRIMHGFYKRGYSSLADMAYVVTGQLAMCLLPGRMAKKLSDRFLREPCKAREQYDLKTKRK